MELWIYRSYFCQEHELDKDFNFAQYLRRALSYGVREQVDVDWSSWMVLLSIILIGLLATTLVESSDGEIIFSLSSGK